MQRFSLYFGHLDKIKQNGMQCTVNQRREAKKKREIFVGVDSLAVSYGNLYKKHKGASRNLINSQRDFFKIRFAHPPHITIFNEKGGTQVQKWRKG